MRIIKAQTLLGFGDEFSDAREPLLNWLSAVKAARWSSIADVRLRDPHADAVIVKSGKTVIVFNFKVNKYRLIVAIHFKTRIVFVLRFLTHAQYSRNAWKDQL